MNIEECQTAVKTLTDLTEGQNREVRLEFTRWFAHRYGLPIQTAYSKIRKGRIKPWEAIGTDRCVQDFCGDRSATANTFYAHYAGNKSEFERMMARRYGMARRTAFYRFREGNFKEWERQGIAHALSLFLRGKECD
jgi:hypothetical protein